MRTALNYKPMLLNLLLTAAKQSCSCLILFWIYNRGLRMAGPGLVCRGTASPQCGQLR